MPAKNPISVCAGCEDTVVRAALPPEQQCSNCRKKERNRIWRAANPGAMAANAKKWREAGNKTERPAEYAEQHRTRERERYRTDPATQEAAKAAAARRRAEKPDETKAALRAWVNKNRDKVRAYNRERARAWYATEAGKAQQRDMRERLKLDRTAANQAYNARRYGAYGEITGAFLSGLYGWQDHSCGYCNAPLNGKHTVEHIVSLERGGSNLPHNVMHVCGPCNSSKQNSYLDTWRPRTVLPAPRWHSLRFTAIAVKMLADAGVGGAAQEGHIVLPNGRKLFVLSTFWMAERMGPAPIGMQALAAGHPDAFFTFDHEWARAPDAMVNAISVKAGVSAPSAGARQMTIDIPSVDDAKAFLGRWHMQGFAAGSQYCGLRESNGIWRAMCSVAQSSKGTAVLGRLAFQGHVPGGFSRLVKAVCRLIPESSLLVTYADSRFGGGTGYSDTGFTAYGSTVPSFHYVNAAGMFHWNAYTKAAMARKLDFYDDTWPTWRLARTNGLWRLDDLPLHRFVLPIQGGQPV